MHSRLVKPGFSFDYLMWLFTRLSGVMMLLLASVGFIGALALGARLQMDLPTLVRWTFFPNPNHVVNSEIPDVNLGWANGFWIMMELLIIFFAVTHAWNGLRVILEDYVGSSGLRTLLRCVIFVLWLASLVMASYLIFTSWVS